jgi:hypothetical protein
LTIDTLKKYLGPKISFKPGIEAAIKNWLETGSRASEMKLRLLLNKYKLSAQQTAITRRQRKESQLAELVEVQRKAEKNDQAKFNSLEYLKSAKVASKRIPIPTVQHDTGYMPDDYTWIDTVKVIKVDRSPVTREWTQNPHTGTDVKDQAIAVESLESVGFSVGVSITVSIQEDDTPSFLYYYAGKDLSDVTDQNVRGFIQMVLAREFGNRSLADCAKDKSVIFDTCFKETAAKFKPLGITVDYLGNTEGLTYDDPNIQEAINQKFKSQNDKDIAQAEQNAATIRNQTAIAASLSQAKAEQAAATIQNETKVATAAAQAEAAQDLAKAKDALLVQADLNIKLAQAEAMRIAAEKWNGSVPSSILPQGTTMMFGLDRPIAGQSLAATENK